MMSNIYCVMLDYLGAPNLLSNEDQGSFSGVELPGHDVVHPLPSSAKVTNEWSHNSALPVCPHIVDRDFTCTFRTHLFVVT